MEMQYGLWVSIFIEHRASLISFAFRMTGSLADAEDLVQETFLECARVDLSKIEHPKSWLVKVCSNKGIDYLKSARKRRESYIGTWLPDALPQGLHPWPSVDEGVSPEEAALLAESLTTSFLLLLEKLSPQERVIFLLSDVLGYSFNEIAKLLAKKTDSCRKAAERARNSIKVNRVRFSQPPKNAEKILAEFFSYAKDGNAQKMVQLLSKNSELWGDGGGYVKAAGHLTGSAEIFEFFIGLISSGIFTSNTYKIEVHRVNNRPGIVILRRLQKGLWCFDTIMSFEFQDEKIARIYAQRNPDKLTSIFFDLHSLSIFQSS